MRSSSSPLFPNPAVFAAMLQQLNPAQRIAVEHIEGPVLVIAGPGTGKTHMLATRIAYILDTTDAYPSNILCLTFTDAGVQAMRQRLLSIIGPDAHKVHIFTFHAFCNKIIRENLDIFGQQRLERCSPIEQSEIARELLQELPWENPLRKGLLDARFYERHLLQLFRWMKMENWTADDVASAVAAYIEGLPDKPEFVYQVSRGNAKKGSPKTAKIAEETRKMDKLLAAAHCFGRYQELLLAKGRYDYEDMILWVLRAFEQYPWLLQRYQEQYLYVLADEYQDTNSAQNELLMQLISYWDQPNIFIVGDDDQSIFEFQGARLQHFSEFYARYEPWVKVVSLAENYRSAQPILDVADVLIRHNETRLVRQPGMGAVNKQLIARHPLYARLSEWPRIRRFPNRLQEMGSVLEHIRQLLSSGVPGKEIAVLFARHKQSEALIRLLEGAGVPYYTKRPVNIFTELVFKQTRFLLQFFQLEWRQPGSGAVLLYELLHLGCWGIDRRTIMDIAVAVQSSGNQDWKILYEPDFPAKAGLKNPDKVAAVLNFLLNHTQALCNRSLLHWFSEVLNRSGLLAWYLEQPDGIWSVQVLKTLTDFIAEQLRLDAALDLEGLMLLLDNMEESGISLELVKTIDQNEGIQLLTAHSAKGLEFAHVFMIDCTRDYWEAGAKTGQSKFSLPETLTLSGQEDALEARRRLFYVACTRAGKSLTISFSETDEQGKLLEPAVFVDEIGQLPDIIPENAQLSPVKIGEMAKLDLLITPSDFAQDPYFDRWLQDFRLSPSSLQQYLECPLGFYYSSVLGIPAVPGENGIFGSVCHEVLQKVFEHMKRSREKVFPDAEAVLTLFREQMQRHRAVFSAESWQQYLSRGETFLPAYVQEKSPHWIKDVVLERIIHTATREGVPIAGTLDKIAFPTPNEVILVDYKTGLPRKEHWREPTTANPFGANAWRQMLFYQVLYEAWDHRGHLVRETQLAYLQPDPVSGELVDKQLSFLPENKSWMEQLLLQTYRQIQQRKFEGCGKKDCKWCTFSARVADNQTLDNEAREWLDDSE